MERRQEEITERILTHAEHQKLTGLLRWVLRLVSVGVIASIGWGLTTDRRLLNLETKTDLTTQYMMDTFNTKFSDHEKRIVDVEKATLNLPAQISEMQSDIRHIVRELEIARKRYEDNERKYPSLDKQ